MPPVNLTMPFIRIGIPPPVDVRSTQTKDLSQIHAIRKVFSASEMLYTQYSRVLNHPYRDDEIAAVESAEFLRHAENGAGAEP